MLPPGISSSRRPGSRRHDPGLEVVARVRHEDAAGVPAMLPGRGRYLHGRGVAHHYGVAAHALRPGLGLDHTPQGAPRRTLGETGGRGARIQRNPETESVTVRIPTLATHADP